MKPAARLFVEAPLRPRAEIKLRVGQAHYLRSVLRLEPGRRVLLFNGRDGEWLAELSQLGKSGGMASPLLQHRPQAPEPDLWLLFAPIKGDRNDGLSEKASELGVSRLQPVMTRYTVVGRVNIERLRARAVEAAEQCQRLTVPEILEPLPLRKVLDAWPSERRLFVCAEAGPVHPFAEALAAEAAAVGRGAACGVLVGPEGGFSPDELDLLRELAFVNAVGLGPRLLRADTAAIAALALWQAVAGDGDRRPPLRFET
jgi:16S rRNA (uracil1498-N3)-methyltransferase